MQKQAARVGQVWGGGIDSEGIRRANSFCGTFSFFWMDMTGNEVKCLIPALQSACLLRILLNTHGDSEFPKAIKIHHVFI